ISVKTVEAHRTHLMDKLGVRNLAGLVKVAIEKGLC
ncbi:MAG TPA: DNA-binding response regulator, partial [Cytophagales bacterium]|nr:DNA-binding response regulator [Cytophagales bacterium]